MNTYLSRRLWMHANDVDFYVMTVFSNTFWASDLRERAKKKHRNGGDKPESRSRPREEKVTKKKTVKHWSWRPPVAR